MTIKVATMTVACGCQIEPTRANSKEFVVCTICPRHGNEMNRWLIEKVINDPENRIM